uniref:glycylpeptide N-tetradecanoyltransferase n=1 Tax=viral metagenome TaxID=1070528 RepID=A0A6C0KR56_9ZZZZ
MILIYILAFLIICIILFFIYIKIKYKFWVLQPVFHFYDIYYWFVNVGIIRDELPQKNRYTNFKNIITKSLENIDKVVIKEIIMLIQLNYLRNDENKYLPKKENIIPYFKGHNAKTFISYFSEPELLIDNKTGLTIETNKIIGVITSRPLHVKIKDKEFDVYYVDYLCVNKNWRKKNIAPQLIQTHEYNQSHSNKKISVSLFKREEELTGIIPLTVYKTYCYNMNFWGQPENLSPGVSLLTCDNQNIFFMYNFLNEKKENFDIIIYPEMGNIIELVNTKNLYIKMLVYKNTGNIEALYIFKKTCTFIKKEKEIISLIASVKGSNIDDNEFIKGFKQSLWVLKKENKIFAYLMVEDISDNKKIINNLSIKTHPEIVTTMAYFFYNFAYNPFKSEKCLIIN